MTPEEIKEECKLQIELNTLEDVEKAFPDDESVRKYLFEIRWGKFAQCPYCHNEKCYFIKHGRCKCAKCKLSFSVTVRSLIDDNKIPFNKLIKIFFLYAKSRGRISPYELATQCEISHKTEFYIREKLCFAWSYVQRDGKNNNEIFSELIKNIFTQYSLFAEIKDNVFSKYPYHIAPDEIHNISIPEQYNKLIRYTRYFITVYARDFIFIDFTTPEEILSEVFLNLQENNIRDYNTQTILRAIWRITTRMWTKFLNDHPKYSEYVKRKNKKRKKLAIASLKDNYIVDILMATKESEGKTRLEIKNNKELIKRKRTGILEKRKKQNKLSEWHSHFD